MSRKLSQTERLLNYLRANGHIQPIEAWTELGIYRLSAVIKLLRDLGYDITSARISSMNRFGEPCSFAEYTLH